MKYILLCEATEEQCLERLAEIKDSKRQTRFLMVNEELHINYEGELIKISKHGEEELIEWVVFKLKSEKEKAKQELEFVNISNILTELQKAFEEDV